MTTKSQEILDALNEIVAAADPMAKDKLAEAIEEFAAERHQSWVSLNQIPFVGRLFDGLVETVDARPGEER